MHFPNYEHVNIILWCYLFLDVFSLSWSLDSGAWSEWTILSPPCTSAATELGSQSPLSVIIPSRCCCCLGYWHACRWWVLSPCVFSLFCTREWHVWSSVTSSQWTLPFRSTFTVSLTPPSTGSETRLFCSFIFGLSLFLERTISLSSPGVLKALLVAIGEIVSFIPSPFFDLHAQHGWLLKTPSTGIGTPSFLNGMISISFPRPTSVSLHVNGEIALFSWRFCVTSLTMWSVRCPYMYWSMTSECRRGEEGVLAGL